MREQGLHLVEDNALVSVECRGEDRCGAPWLNSALTTSRWPFLTAAMRGVTPSWSSEETRREEWKRVRMDGGYDERDVG